MAYKLASAIFRFFFVLSPFLRTFAADETPADRHAIRVVYCCLCANAHQRQAGGL